MRNKPITMAQIAETCGLSRPTVSYVLNGREGKYSTSTRESVMAAALKLGYRPNRAAQCLRRGQFRTISFLYAKESYLPRALLTQMAAETRDRGLRIDLATFEAEQHTDPDYVPDPGRERFADGALLATGIHDLEGLAGRLERTGIPTIRLNCLADHNAAFPDDRQVGRLAAETLLRHGHRSAFCIVSADPHYSSEERRDGFQAAFRDGGGATECFARHSDDAALWGFLRDRLERPGAPTCAFTANEPITLMTGSAAMAAGRRRAEDFSVVAVVDRDLPHWGHTTAHYMIPWTEVAAAAMADMMRRLVGARSRPARRIPYGDLVMGDSLASRGRS